MDRERIIELGEFINKSMFDGSAKTNHAFDEGVIIFAQQAVKMLKEQEWNILTEDADGIVHGLPGDDGAYLMTDGKDIWIDDYVDSVVNGIFLDSGRDIHDIKAWMYVPELPK